MSPAGRLSGIDCDPDVRKLITVESYVAAVADQGKHPGVAEHDVGLQVRHATCRRGGDNGAEKVASQPPPSPAGGNSEGELTVAVRQDGVARLGNQCVRGAGNDRDQAISAFILGPGQLLKELTSRMAQAEEAVVPVVIGEPVEQRVQPFDVGLRHGPHGKGRAIGKAQGGADATGGVRAGFRLS